MSRFAKSMRVCFWEEPVHADASAKPSLSIVTCVDTGVEVITPALPSGMSEEAADVALRGLLGGFIGNCTDRIVRWYYTPMMLPFSRDLQASCTVYDCMDELSNFRFAPATLRALEQELLREADVVFTGGKSLYEAKKGQHANVHCFPSSIDAAHFSRSVSKQPRDQADIPQPRCGYYGVIDERIDLALLEALADARPDWSIVMLGPVVKISQEDLPRRDNIFYLGQKAYADLPDYLAGWDVAMMPFAINDATRFISPTKTPEYLAGGKPVISTPVQDVVRSYGQLEGVHICANAEEFAQTLDAARALNQSPHWRAPVEALLSTQSWEATASKMAALIDRHSKGHVIAMPKGAARDAVAKSAQRPHYDVLVVGAGFAGSVIAERLARTLQKRVLVIDRRDHIGGNAFDKFDAAGVLMHQYGPHIFHTNSDDVFAYLSEFTAWRPYEHRVLARIGRQDVPVPINRTTLNALYGLDLRTDEDAAQFLAQRAEVAPFVRTSEDVVLASVGRDLYNKFFRGYTRKQWGMDPRELDKSVTARVPTRTNTDDRYFTDTHQAMPLHGYTEMFGALLDHPRISVELGVDFESVRQRINCDLVVYTGPIDAYFNYKHGPLPYRSLRFRHETLNRKQFQSVGTVNYPDEATPFTRITEYKHLTGQKHAKTTITYEFPTAEGDPYYPIPTAENHERFKRYEAMARGASGVVFVGRLASYRYYNMDQVVGQALATARRLGARRDLESAATPTSA
jgi:UDP-galactopyranose mutase